VSHTTTIDLQVKDEDAFAQACRDLGYEVARNASAKLFQSGSNFNDATVVKIPGWNYPVVCKDGKLHFDNYNGRWGDNAQLDKLKQRYARNVAIKTARARGFRVQEKTVDGKVKLTLTRG
jgi:hypothetical protein